MFEWEDVGTAVGEGICKPILVLGICCARNYKVYVVSEIYTAYSPLPILIVTSPIALT